MPDVTFVKFYKEICINVFFCLRAFRRKSQAVNPHIPWRRCSCLMRSLCSLCLTTMASQGCIGILSFSFVEIKNVQLTQRLLSNNVLHLFTILVIKFQVKFTMPKNQCDAISYTQNNFIVTMIVFTCLINYSAKTIPNRKKVFI